MTLLEDSMVRRGRIMTTATTDDRGVWCAAVLYAVYGGRLVFHSSTDTRHGAAMERAGVVAGAIAGRWRGITRIRGWQFTGLVRRTEEGEARKAYLRRYPVARLMPLTLWELEIRSAKRTAGFEKEIWSE